MHLKSTVFMFLPFVYFINSAKAAAPYFKRGHRNCLGKKAFAECKLVSNANRKDLYIDGYVKFEQKLTRKCKPFGKLTMTVNVTGVPTTHRYHGIHIHAQADPSNKCELFGGHFNPLSKDHGPRRGENRHVGDLGNARILKRTGKISFTRRTKPASLAPGPFNVVGRGIVLHEKRDDLGRGGDVGSLTTGNAGGRLACCTITKLGDW